MGLTSKMTGIRVAFNLDDYYHVRVIFSDTKEERRVYFKKMSIAGEYVRLYDIAVHVTDTPVCLGGYDFDGDAIFIPDMDVGYIYYTAVDKITIYPPNGEDSYVLFEKAS